MQKVYKDPKTNKGFSLIEVLFASALLTVFLGVLMAAYTLYFQAATAGPQHSAAVFLADEGVEAMRSIRDRGWDEEIEVLANNTEYHLVLDGGAWHATTTPQNIDGVFTRTVTLHEVERDGDDSITETGGVVDSGTRRIEVEVSWDGLLGDSTAEITAYIANVFDI